MEPANMFVWWKTLIALYFVCASINVMLVSLLIGAVSIIYTIRIPMSKGIKMIFKTSILWPIYWPLQTIAFIAILGPWADRSLDALFGEKAK